MDKIKENIGLRIKELRLKTGISQEELALRADLDRTYINSVENGKRNISIVNIERIALALNSSIKAFFNSERFN
jgi:transcriptional regulator with XRE-family HTH domain